MAVTTFDAARKGLLHVVASGENNGISTDVMSKALVDLGPVDAGKVAEYLEHGRVLAKTKGATIEPRTYLGGAVVDAFSAAFGRIKVPTFRRLAEILADPPVPHFVRDLFVKGTAVMIFAPKNRGKSFLVLDLAVSVAAGLKTWMGRDLLVHGPVALVYTEGTSSLNKRVFVACEKHKVNANELPIMLRPIPANLTDPKTIDALITELQENPPVLLVFDTLSQNMPGGRENDTEQMSGVVDTINRIRAAIPGLTIIMTHHPTKASEDVERGSSTLAGALDTVLSVKDAKGVFELTPKYARDTGKSEVLPYRLKIVECLDADGNVAIPNDLGLPETSCIIEYLDEGAVEAAKSEAAQQADRIMTVLTSQPQSASEILAALRKQGRGFQKGRFYSALKMLVEQKLVSLTDKGLYVLPKSKTAQGPNAGKIPF